MTNNNENTKKSWITEGLVIASVPFVAYILTYQFEVGFASVFKIPKSFIKFDLTNILIAIVAIFTIFMLLFPYFNLVFIIVWPKRDNPIYRSLIKIGLMLPVVAIPIYLHGTRWREWVFVLILPVIIAGLEFLTPLLHKNESSYMKKMKVQEAIDRRTPSLFSPLGNNGILVFIIFVSLFFISFSAGRAEAFDQVEFLVVNAQPECVVLKIYEEKLICSNFNRNTKEVCPEFRIFEIGTDSNLIMNQERIGPLHPKVSDTPKQNAPNIQWVTATPIVTSTVAAP